MHPDTCSNLIEPDESFTFDRANCTRTKKLKGMIYVINTYVSNVKFYIIIYVGGVCVCFFFFFFFFGVGEHVCGRSRVCRMKNVQFFFILLFPISFYFHFTNKYASRHVARIKADFSTTSALIFVLFFFYFWFHTHYR